MLIVAVLEISSYRYTHACAYPEVPNVHEIRYAWTVIPMLARIQSLLPIGFPGENNVSRHGEVVMFQKRVAKMRLHVLQPVLFHNGNQPSIVSVTIADVVLPTLVYAVPSGGASHIQFPVIGIGNYIHALLTGQRILPACLVVLPVVPE